MSHCLFSLALLTALLPMMASAQRLVAVSDMAKLQEICQLPAATLSKELYFTKVSGASFNTYNPKSGTLPLNIEHLTGLSGAITLKTNTPTLEASLSEDIAQALVTMMKEGKTEIFAAFRVDPLAPCTKETSEGKETYSLVGALALLEISRATNGRPLLRFETNVYTQWKKEESLSVVLTPPTVLSGEGTIGKISDILPKSKPSIQRCYARLLTINPKAQGTLTARISLNQDGDPEDVTITIDTLGDKSVQSCVVESLKQNRYAAPNTSFSFTMYMLQQ